MTSNNSVRNTSNEQTTYSWRCLPLTELVSEIIDNRGRSAPTAASGIPLIATNCIKEDGLYPIREKLRYVSEETYRTWFRGHPEPGDIIIVNKGTPGLVCQVPDPVDFCIAQDMVALRADDRVVDKEFLLAALRSPYFKHQVEVFNVGTTIPHLKKTDFSKLLVPVPPRKVQEFIGHLYCSLCRKIELNRRIIQMLEAMMQALYKHWFVAFGPFNDLLVSEQERITQGWTVGSLYEQAQFVNGAAFRQDDFSENRSGLPIIKIAELKYGITNQTQYTLKELDSKYKIHNGEILFSWSGSPDTSIDIFTWADGTGWLNQHTFSVLPNRPTERAYVYCMLRYMKPTFVEIARNKQTTGLGHVTVQDMRRMNVVVPPAKVMEAFDRIVGPQLDTIIANKMESQTLTRTRDYLLPKLLSGEVEVKAAEETVEAVM
jgi:type I restriction enzyme S subunit